MSDIVDRLLLVREYHSMMYEQYDTVTEAAAEITRLRAERDELQQTNAEQATIIIDYGQQLAEARDNKDRLIIAAAASVKASMDEYKRGHADGVKSGREEGFEKAATELERLDGHGEWCEAAQAIRALKSPKPPIL